MLSCMHKSYRSVPKSHCTSPVVWCSVYYTYSSACVYYAWCVGRSKKKKIWHIKREPARNRWGYIKWSLLHGSANVFMTIVFHFIWTKVESRLSAISSVIYTSYTLYTNGGMTVRCCCTCHGISLGHRLLENEQIEVLVCNISLLFLYNVILCDRPA